MFKSIGLLLLGVITLTGCSGSISDEALANLPPPEAGKKVFEAKCKGCHTINGAGGVRGPNLSNVGGRMDEPTLRAFIKDPQAVRPGARMPQISLTDKQLDAAAAYLAGLK
ncbi:MAG: cytochrome c [Nitrospirae bacterium]|nr:cytochrome c [Candidatus Manganitrophaceae bacterium]